MQIGFNLPISGPLSSPEIVTRIARQAWASPASRPEFTRPSLFRLRR